MRLTRSRVCLVSCCNNVCKWVPSLVRLNGPTRQLLVLVLKFVTWLLAVLWVARTSIGRPELSLSRCCSILRLLTCGSFRLSIVRLKALSSSVRRVSSLL